MDKQQKAFYKRVIQAANCDPLYDLASALYNEGMREESFASAIREVLLPEPVTCSVRNYLRDLERGFKPIRKY